jgi:hypothetical protein
MNKEEIIKNNILLAEFLGWEYVYYAPCWNHPIIDGAKTENDFDYASNWNSLMEVVEKIESIRDEEYGKFSVSIRSNTCDIHSSHLWKVVQGIDPNAPAYMSDCNAIFPTKLESTYYNVVRFVEWYNELLKNRENGRI